MKFAIVSYLDPSATNTIRSIQEKVLELTGSRIALEKWNPHITVGAGVDIQEEQMDDFLDELNTVSQSQKPFTIELADYGFIDNWTKGQSDGHSLYVVYIDAKVNPDLLELVASIKGNVTSNYDLYYGELYKEINEYKPHVTVAFSDLDEKSFLTLKSLLSKERFTIRATIDHFSIAAEKSDGRWVEEKRFPFKK